MDLNSKKKLILKLKELYNKIHNNRINKLDNNTIVPSNKPKINKSETITNSIVKKTNKKKIIDKSSNSKKKHLLNKQKIIIKNKILENIKQISIKFNYIKSISKYNINKYNENKLQKLSIHLKKIINEYENIITNIKKKNILPMVIIKNKNIVEKIKEYTDGKLQYIDYIKKQEVKLEATTGNIANPKKNTHFKKIIINSEKIKNESFKVKKKIPKELIKTNSKPKYDLEKLDILKKWFLNNNHIVVENIEILAEINKQLDKFKSQPKSDFLKFGVTSILKNNPTIEIMQEITKQLAKVESPYKTDFLYYGISNIFKNNPTIEHFKIYMQEITKQLAKVESPYKTGFLYYGISNVLKNNPTIEIMQEITKQLPTELIRTAKSTFAFISISAICF